ncbi:SWIM zinc finger family protein [Salinibaculum rarum]|uniref:SWIM zinc finger family protein n=1 Tax=Salinibaculum rarum TaxID=3058903 RepID=UPI00265EE69D|nr:SWIM zinc finger family protein [Salinibaculum sp. KK48]
MDYPTWKEIRSLCTEQSFERGVKYWENGRVQELDVDGERIEATVRGSNDYDISIDVTNDAIRTHCSCPYDYAGDCKHIVAVLLAVDDRDIDTDTDSGDEPIEDLPDSVDVESLVEQATADKLRTFLLDVLEDDRDLRDRFVAFSGEDAGKTVYDYKQEIDRLFEDAAGRGGMIGYNTHIDFSQYHDLAETHRERGHVGAATDIYRALAETIRENMNRIDDSGGYYGRELERALALYGEAVAEHEFGHEQKRPYIDYLFEEFVDADYHFASEDYDNALRSVCTTKRDHEYWLDRLDEHVSGISLDPADLEKRATGRTNRETDRMEVQVESSAESPSNGDHEPGDTRDRTDDVLAVSDFTDGPLAVEDFTGGPLDVEHLAVGPLELEYFVGDAFDALRIDDPTTIEEHTVDVGSGESSDSGAEISSSLRTRALVSTCAHLLEELDEEKALLGLYEETYLESSRFCKQYAQRLIEEGNEGRAIDVIEDGIHTFGSPAELRWLAADLYRDRGPEKHREALKRLFLDHSEWGAYDELKKACDDEGWQSIYEEFEEHFEETDRQQLISMYVHEDELEKAFDELKDSENLSWLRRYRDPVATVDPVEYFEVYREQLVPFAAGETGRRHYREIADHLDEMQELVPEERFEAFVDFLMEKHSNRPAFLDELEKAGF